MDVDGDIDGHLLQQFRCLGTTDRDVLVLEFQKLIGNQLNTTGCAFLLDMNNWNLEAAVSFFFDSQKFNVPLMMTLVRDVTVGEGEEVPPSTKFAKTWRIQNTGIEEWPVGCRLCYVSGNYFNHVNEVHVAQLKPYETVDLSVEMESPSTPGMYEQRWRMRTALGAEFGDNIWVILTVSPSGILGLTQQLEAFHHLGANPESVSPNPFLSNDLNRNCESYSSVSLHTSQSSSLSPSPPLSEDKQEFSSSKEPTSEEMIL